jgi:hypothetical protein
MLKVLSTLSCIGCKRFACELRQKAPTDSAEEAKIQNERGGLKCPVGGLGNSDVLPGRIGEGDCKTVNKTLK